MKRIAVIAIAFAVIACAENAGSFHGLIVKAMAEMARTNADINMRSRLRELGARLITEAAVREWHGDGATVYTFGGSDERVAADSLVIAATNVPERILADEFGAPGVGDALAARTAVMAIYEGRKLAMRL